jgi:5-methylthioadenosine/S-adenosylhomocysteine deaminase
MADRKLIKDGIVLTLDRGIGDFDRADVLVEDGRIAAVGPDLEAPEGVEIIDASRAIVMPGFVDTHRHTWQAQLRTIACDWTLGQYMTGLHSGLSGHFRPEDTYIGNLLGTVEALDSGITTLLDWSHNLATPEHADAAVEGLKESGAVPSSPTVAAPRSGTCCRTPCRTPRTPAASAPSTSRPTTAW